MTKHRFMSKEHASDWRIETGGDRTSHTTPYKHICCQNPTSHPTDEASHCGAKMHQRSVLANRRATTRRDEGGQSRTETRTNVEFVISAMRRIDAVRRAMPTGNTEKPAHSENEQCRHDQADQGRKRHLLTGY